MLSVIIPVFKAEQSLRKCVDSILEQTYRNLEIVLIDDGSPDGSPEICDEYAKCDSRVKVIHQKNRGVSVARNTGLDHVSGEYITFVDSDDMVGRTYLETLRAGIEKCNTNISCCRISNLKNKKAIKDFYQTAHFPIFEVITSNEALIDIYRGKVEVGVSSCAKLYKRELFDSIRFPVGKIHEDSAVIPLVLYRGATIAKNDLELYYYRYNVDSITKNDFNQKRYDHLWSVDKCIRFFEEKNEIKIVEAAKSKKSLLMSIYAIKAKKVGVEVPPEYKISIFKALYYLRKNTSNDYYEFYLAMISPKLAHLFEYEKKLKQILRS